MESQAVSATPGAIFLPDLAASILQQTLKSVCKALPPAAKRWQDDAEHIHQLRVSCRRAMAAVQFFADVIPASPANWHHKNLKALLRAAGRARDLDVLMENQLPRCGSAARKLKKILVAERKKVQKPLSRLHRKLKKGDRFRRKIRKLSRAVRAISEEQSLCCEEWVRLRLSEFGRTFFGAIPVDADLVALHQIRILAKRFRYTLDLLKPILASRELTNVTSALTKLQKQLGTLQDHVVAREHLQRLLSKVSVTRHQKRIRALIDEESRAIDNGVARFRFWGSSTGCQHLKSEVQALACPAPCNSVTHVMI